MVSLQCIFIRTHWIYWFIRLYSFWLDLKLVVHTDRNFASVMKFHASNSRMKLDMQCHKVSWFRSSRSQMFYRIGVLKNFANFIRKHLYWSNKFKSLFPSGLQLYLKETPAQVFPCEICEIFKNTSFYRAPVDPSHFPNILKLIHI